jgi:3-hydroxyacyl-CoA dehydrogenase
VKRATEAVAGNASASLWDLGDGVLCLEFHGKMNAIDPDVMAMVRTAVLRVGQQHRALVIHNEGSQFSVGANLGLALFAANTAAWDQIDAIVREGQEAYAALKHAPFPVVGAPSGMALGGGCEVLLHCDAVVAHAETYMGLVETGVGLVPAWGGCKEMLLRWWRAPGRPGGPMPPVSKVFETVSMATVAKSAEQARDLLFLRPEDEIVMNRDRVLAAAKARALALAQDYAPPEAVSVSLPGPAGAAALDMAVDGFAKVGKATRHDRVVAAALARVLSGGEADLLDELDEALLLALERREFMALVRHPDTLARVEHMLETGRALRN